jgi:hypothetical protein
MVWIWLRQPPLPVPGSSARMMSSKVEGRWKLKILLDVGSGSKWLEK